MAKEETSIASMEDSFGFFRDKLKELYRRRAEAFLAPDALLEIFDTATPRELLTDITLYGMRETPVYLLLEGFFQSPGDSENFLLFATAGSLKAVFVLPHKPKAYSAFFGQFFTHSKQRIHSVPFFRFRELSVTSTSIGHTFLHLPQEIHLLLSHLICNREK